jgi:hypothetical protein
MPVWPMASTTDGQVLCTQMPTVGRPAFSTDLSSLCLMLLGSTPQHPSRPISRVLSWAVIYLGQRLPAVSSSLPEARTGRAAPCPPKRVSPLLGLAPDGGCLAAHVTTDAGGLLHHLFTITRAASLPRLSAFLWPFSVGSPRLGVTQHRALWSPDFPHPVVGAQPPGRLEC